MEIGTLVKWVGLRCLGIVLSSCHPAARVTCINKQFVLWNDNDDNGSSLEEHHPSNLIEVCTPRR